jgi:hypothetical protein
VYRCFIIFTRQRNFTLRYTFTPGENIQYKTERQDSTESGTGDQTDVTEMTIWSLQSLSIVEALPDQSFKVIIKTDSLWTDQESQPQRQPGGRRMMRMGRESRERAFEITNTGMPVSTDATVSPLLIPMPENPVAIDGTWDFEINTEQTGRRQGKTTVKGQCLLYDVEKDGNQTRATIVVTSETVSEGQFSFQGQSGSVSGTYASSGSNDSIVYFDIEKGRIIEIASEGTRESVTESTLFSRSSKTKSKTTIIMVSE